MPYRFAYVYLAALLAAAMLAFWPGYLRDLPAAPFELHAHGITASLWLLLLIAQSWTIHHGGRDMHRLVGRLSLILFPLFLAGGMLILVGFAKHYVEGVAPFYVNFAPRLAVSDFVSMTAIAFCYFQALRLRRSVQLHARYMLMTPLFLLGPIFGRLLSRFGPLSIHDPAEMYLYADILRVIAGATIVGLVLLYRQAPRYGRPYVEMAGVVLLQEVLVETVGTWPPWARFYAHLADAPTAITTGAAIVGGVVIALAGWRAGALSTTSKRAASRSL